ncbi:MAG: hypothetical protein A3H39_11705 [candidate division NC10 bacterium RIFCSPLOWO2_02_FULL_66_22]|nr:MAG: hypothetical protein A3H39_11705 [candidate division NC10 bacterium RIFCSPLOWO2_02_FULL_66_22]
MPSRKPQNDQRARAKGKATELTMRSAREALSRFVQPVRPPVLPAVRRPSARLGSALVHLGALIRDIGIIAQEGLTPEQERKLLDAKAVLRRRLEDLRDAIRNDTLPPDFRLVLADAISEVMGMIFTCTLRGMVAARDRLGSLRRFISDIEGGAGRRPWKDDLITALYFTALIELKQRNDELLTDWPDAGDGLRFERRENEIVYLVGTEGPPVYRWPIDPSQREAADALIRELNDTIHRCDYPTPEMARRLHELASPQ